MLSVVSMTIDAAADNPNATATIQGNRVIASSFPPGATVVFYCVALVGDGYNTTTRSFVARLTDDDRDGSITCEYPGALPFRSVWIVVNEANGDYALTSPRGFYHADGPQPAFRKHAALVDEVGWPGRVTYLLYVHPGKGAWTSFSIDGRDDADGTSDYVTSFALSRLKPVQKDNPDKPSDLKPGGTLFIVDGQELTSTALKLDGAMLNGAK